MRVNSVNKSPLNFKGGVNKILLKGLEKISDHGASFAAGVSFACAVGLRPLAISLTPKAKKENKDYACANSVASGLMKLLIAEGIAIPIENAISHIEKNPEKFLKKETIENLTKNSKDILSSKDFKFLSQSTKMGTGLLSAIPKSVLTVALIPVIMDKILRKKPEKKEEKTKINEYNPVFSPVYDKLSFKGAMTEKLAHGIGKIFDISSVQKFAQKHSANEANIARNVSMMTDALLVATGAVRIKKSDKIQKENKNPLIYNNLISTGLSLACGFGLDKLVQKTQKGAIEKFIKNHAGDPKLPKYLEGINILRPTLIFALIYYGVLPVVSTFFADKLDGKFSSNKET